MNAELESQPTEALVAKKKEILDRQVEESETVHAINQVLHARNMIVMAEKKRTDFLKANGVEIPDRLP